MSDKKTVLMVIVAVLMVAGAVAAYLLSKQSQDITSFQECKNAGGAVMESYPEQCMKEGRSFTSEAQIGGQEANKYVGLTERAALEKAKSENRVARVVERDGESLPVTMDFMPGRLNLHVKDGKVESVLLEGE